MLREYTTESLVQHALTMDRINDKPFELLKLDGKATTGLHPNKTNWANPITKAPFFG